MNTTNKADSILAIESPNDERYYGLFYLQIPSHLPGYNKEPVKQITEKEPYSLEEVFDFNKFFKLTNVTLTEKEIIANLVTLFLEDIKFIKRIHKEFAENKAYLGNMGFLAGGKKCQILHRDTEGFVQKEEDSFIPFSCVIPIGIEGRDLYIHGDEAENLTHMKYGEAAVFNGNILHGGAVSKASCPLQNLALHIHIDSTSFIRKPNLLEIVV
jgi:hypothetical protein